MRANRKTNTKPELALRAALHARGLRYRVHLPILDGGLRVVPDVVFPRARIALFADGCLWHQCPDHGSTPRTNADYWTAKLARNAERDRRVDAALASTGWRVVRVWEHRLAADADAVAAEIADLVRRR
jgi:DNA mismatch endonuclease (patch repair protein)